MLMDVAPAPEPEVEEPEVVEALQPKEEEIFKKPEKKVIKEETESQELIPEVAAPKKKRGCTPKLAAHLKKCREKSKAIRVNKAKDRVDQTLEDIADLRPVSIDYDRIIKGVRDTWQPQRSAVPVIDENKIRETIRGEEQERAKKQYGELFMEAADKFKKKTYAGYGRTVLTGGQTHPVFGRTYKKTEGKNPFSSCFD